MSYFAFYFNTLGDMSQVGYSKPVNLKRFDRDGWMFTPLDLHFISEYLTEAKHYDIADKKILEKLPPADKAVLNAVFLDADEEGLFKPKKK